MADSSGCVAYAADSMWWWCCCCPAGECSKTKKCTRLDSARWASWAMAPPPVGAPQHWSRVLWARTFAGYATTNNKLPTAPTNASETVHTANRLLLEATTLVPSLTMASCTPGAAARMAPPATAPPSLAAHPCCPCYAKPWLAPTSLRSPVEDPIPRSSQVWLQLHTTM